MLLSFIKILLAVVLITLLYFLCYFYINIRLLLFKCRVA